MKDKDTPELQSHLTGHKASSALCGLSNERFQYILFAKSAELSKRGIAPQWQGLAESCFTDDHLDSFDALKPVIDLFWLVAEYPKHRCGNGRWNKLWDEGFDMGLAISIDDRKKKNAAKVIELELSIPQQMGCLRFQRSEAKVALKRLKDNINKHQKRRQEELSARKVSNGAPAEDIAAQQAVILACAKATGGDGPTATAQLYRQITGGVLDRRNVARAVKRARR